MKPLIKWAGGKRQILPRLLENVPEHFGSYYEPFVGGGAFFVDLAARGSCRSAVIGDLNPELVNLYSVIKSRPKKLNTELASASFVYTRAAFNSLRAEYNTLMAEKKQPVRRAALFLYLNKHSYNGLWRVNRSGKYNVPFGSHRRLTLPSPDQVIRFSSLLGPVTIRKGDFITIIRGAGRGDFVYFDPPYHPVSKTANFTDYTMNGFDFSEQERLAGVFARLAERGLFVMLSNSDVPEITELYDGFHIRRVPAKRFINCNGERRTGASELIVTNY